MLNLVNVATLQMKVGDDVEANLVRASEMIAAAAAQGAELVCLQELFSLPYFCQREDHSRFDLAEPIPGPTSRYLCELARRHQIVLVAGLFEQRTAGLYHNTALVIERDGTVAGRYRKMHIPDDPLFYEKFYFAPGDLGFQAIPTSVGTIGVCICWDQWFPEAARMTALKGAEILVYPTAIGWNEEDKQNCGDAQIDAWKTIMRSHAIANGLFVVAPNRVGTEGDLEFWGNSFVADPYGSVLAQADATEQATLSVECDLSLIGTARTHWPFLRDRRIDAYQGLDRLLLDERHDDRMTHHEWRGLCASVSRKDEQSGRSVASGVGAAPSNVVNLAVERRHLA